MENNLQYLYLQELNNAQFRKMFHYISIIFLCGRASAVLTVTQFHELPNTERFSGFGTAC